MPGQYDDIISDMFKDANGFRPGVQWLQAFEASTSEDQDREVAYLERCIKQEIELERAQQDEATSRYIDSIAGLRVAGARNDAQAIQWLVDSLDKSWLQDGGEVCYTLGLPYHMAPIFEDAVRNHNKVVDRAA